MGEQSPKCTGCQEVWGSPSRERCGGTREGGGALGDVASLSLAQPFQGSGDLRRAATASWPVHAARDRWPQDPESLHLCPLREVPSAHSELRQAAPTSPLSPEPLTVPWALVRVPRAFT